MSESQKNLPLLLLILLLLVGGGAALVLSGIISNRGPVYDATVSGTVTIDGSLAKSGTVTFHPWEGGQPATGRIHSDGSYSLRTGQGNLGDPDGGSIAPGGYVVTVAINGPSLEDRVGESGPPLPGPSLVAEKYRDRSTSDLKKVIKSGNNVVDLELDGAHASDGEAETSAEEGQNNAATAAETEEDSAEAADDSAEEESAEISTEQ